MHRTASDACPVAVILVFYHVKNSFLGSRRGIRRNTLTNDSFSFTCSLAFFLTFHCIFYMHTYTIFFVNFVSFITRIMNTFYRKSIQPDFIIYMKCVWYGIRKGKRKASYLQPQPTEGWRSRSKSTRYGNDSLICLHVLSFSKHA
jgi:hypothetical protein